MAAIFKLDLAEYELTRGGETIKLERLPMQLLMLLVERSGRLVTRTEIVQRLWSKDVFVDFDNSINTAIRKLRRAFQDDTESPFFIQTLTGKGYRFVGPITVIPAEQDSPKTSPAGAFRRVMLAVLPFENMSSDPEHEYFSDGLTEETISYLGQMDPERMGVIARTSSMRYKHTTKDIGQVGRELGVDYILESSVRREGGRVRITSQLILVKEQTHLWAETFDRDLTSFLSLQAELGKAISRQVQIRLDPESTGQERAGVWDLNAYDLFLRGKHHWNRYSHRQGIDCFLQAIAADPTYAPAYAALANCYHGMTLAFDEPALTVLPKALAAATRAVELDDRSADAHTSLGIVKTWLEWDWPGAESSFRRALELNSNSVDAHMHYAHLLSNNGRHREAWTEIEIARQLDPFAPGVAVYSGILMYHARAYDLAAERFQTALLLNSVAWLVNLFLGKVWERKGMIDEALAALQAAFGQLTGNTEIISIKGYIHGRHGCREEAEQAIRLLTELGREKYVPPYNVALIYAGLGNVAQALKLLENAYETRDVRMVFLAVEPKWDCLRGCPEFQELLRTLGLPREIVTWESGS